jgi:hypothetical protein
VWHKPGRVAALEQNSAAAAAAAAAGAAAGTMGLKGNLCCGEIVEQLVHATRVTPIRNIVFMVRQQHPAAAREMFRGYHCCGAVRHTCAASSL